MSGWIKWEKEIEADPRFGRMLRKLKALHGYAQDVTLVRDESVTPTRDGVTAAFRIDTLLVGALTRFWVFADTYIRADDTLDMSSAEIDDYVGLPGFADCMPKDWLRVIDDEHVELPEYQKHNGVAAKKRDQAAKRQERKRARDRHEEVTPKRDARVTAALPDQTRPDQKRPDQEREERARARGDVPRGTGHTEANNASSNGVIDCGDNLTRSGEDIAGRVDREFEAMLNEWRNVPGINIGAFQEWIEWLAKETPPKRLSANTRYTQAEAVAGYGDAATQARALKRCMQNGWRNPRPLDRDERQAGDNTPRLTTEQLEEREIRRLAASGATHEAIAAEVEVSLDRVREVLSRNEEAA